MPAPEAALEGYLRERIPLSAALGVRVIEADSDHVRLAAPLATNINHCGTVFGGSAVAIATLAAWGALRVRLSAAGITAQTVIQRSRMEYEHPISGDFEAECRLTDPLAWTRFTTVLARRGRARLRLTSELLCAGARVAHFEGEFVAMDPSRARPDPPGA